MLVRDAANTDVAAKVILQARMLSDTVRTASRQTWVDLDEIIRPVCVRAAVTIGDRTHPAVLACRPCPSSRRMSRHTILTHRLEAVDPDIFGYYSAVRRVFPGYLE